ncbi:hypothetical protein ACWC5I_39960 [Kitasatospora sp. NPDC001574]
MSAAGRVVRVSDDLVLDDLWKRVAHHPASARSVTVVTDGRTLFGRMITTKVGPGDEKYLNNRLRYA